MTPWSIGWKTDVVLGGKNINLALERLPIVGCAGQLSIINAIFLFSLKNFSSNSRTHSSNKVLSIQLFRCDRYRHGSDFTFLKHRGFWNFPITNILEVRHQLHLLPRNQWFLSYCAFHLNTCRTLSEMFPLTKNLIFFYVLYVQSMYRIYIKQYMSYVNFVSCVALFYYFYFEKKKSFNWQTSVKDAKFVSIVYVL